jgi:spore germination protein KA
MNLLKKFLVIDRKMKDSSEDSNASNNAQEQLLSNSLQENIDKIKQDTGNSKDIIIKELSSNNNNNIRMGIIYTNGLVNKNFVQDFILDTISKKLEKVSADESILSQENVFMLLKQLLLPIGCIDEIGDLDTLYIQLFSGNTITLIDGYNKAIVANSGGGEQRGVEEPSSQTSVRGPKDGFTETLTINISLIRRRIKNPSLWIESKTIGKKTKTDVSILYIKGIASDEIIGEVHSRLDKINIDAILESGYIESLIQDKTFTPFPTMLNTERPDTAAEALLDGRIVIIVDGTPFVLIVPALFVNFFQSSEDYYQRYDISSLIRILRFGCFFIALLTPATYVAITSFHQEMIPTTLIISVAAQREGVPFPVAIEAFLMEVTFEILREAGIRMPRAIGSAMSIVGALVLGEAAVQAGTVSSMMVIIVSITAIASFVSPYFNMAISVRMLRFVFLLLGSTFGLYGIALGLITMVLHLCGLRSFGIPYLYPIGPFNTQDQADTIVRFPLWLINRRPSLISQKDEIRQRDNKKMKTEDSNKEK